MAAVKRVHNASQVIILTASTMSERMDAPVARDRSPQQAMIAARCPAASRALFTSAVGITQAKEPHRVQSRKTQRSSSPPIHRFRTLVPARHQPPRRFHRRREIHRRRRRSLLASRRHRDCALYEKSVSGEGSQVWKLTVNPDRSASLVCDDGNHNFVNTHQIEFTDFPIDEIKFYFTDNTILLPSEY
jgi:hypothetical protein